MAIKSKRQKRIEKYMKLENLLNYQEAKEQSAINHLKFLKNLYDGLILEYGIVEGKKIFILMLGDSIQYQNLIMNSKEFSKEKIKFRKKEKQKI